MIVEIGFNNRFSDNGNLDFIADVF